MVPLPTKQPPSQTKNGHHADRASSSSSSSSSSLFWSLVTPMFYIGFGILLYQHWMTTTSIHASSLHMATITTTTTPPTFVKNEEEDYCTNFPPVPPLPLQQQRNNNNNNNITKTNIQQQQLHYKDTLLQSIDPTKVIFYHLNVPETYGAYLNRYMARTYHTVCGPFAYSIDQPIDIRTTPRIDPESSSLGPTPDRTKTWNRMQQIGLQNCQWISGNSSVSVVPSVAMIHYLQHLGFHVHLVIPCPRDVLSHRLSICSAVGAPLSKWLLLKTKTKTKTKTTQKKKNKKKKKKKDDDDDDEDELCTHLIQDCVYTRLPYYDEKLVQMANSTSYFGSHDFAQVDRLVAGYLPERGYVLPRPTSTSTTTPSYYFAETIAPPPQQQKPRRKQYAQQQIQEVRRRCGARVQEHFLKTTPLYQACAKAKAKTKGDTLV